MNKHKACEILGILPDTGIEELKKRYHLLMVVTHPDSVSEHDYPYEVHEINRAYEYMLDHLEEEQIREKTLETKRIRWNAPVNPNAFAARPIYQYYEDEDGNRVGLMTVDQGRYIWIPDEEFSLVLKSLYTTAKEIIDLDDEAKHIDRSRDMSLMGDITYLIAGQFFGADMAFSLMKWDENSESYYSKAMLELASGENTLNDGDIMIPGSVRDPLPRNTPRRNALLQHFFLMIDSSISKEKSLNPFLTRRIPVSRRICSHRISSVMIIS